MKLANLQSKWLVVGLFLLVVGSVFFVESAEATVTLGPEHDFGAGYSCDVDLGDFTVFQECMGGANEPPGCLH